MSVNISNAVFIPGPQGLRNMADLGKTISEKERKALTADFKDRLQLSERLPLCKALRRIVCDKTQSDRLVALHKKLSAVLDLTHACPVRDKLPEAAWLLMADIAQEFSLTVFDMTILAYLVKEFGDIDKTLSFFQSKGGVILKWYSMSPGTASWIFQQYPMSMEFQDACQEELKTADNVLDGKVDALFAKSGKNHIDPIAVDELIKEHYRELALGFSQDTVCSDIADEIRPHVFHLFGKEGKLYDLPAELAKAKFKDFIVEAIMKVKRQTWEDALGKNLTFRGTGVSVSLSYTGAKTKAFSDGEDDAYLLVDILRSVFSDKQPKEPVYDDPRYEDFSKFMVQMDMAAVTKSVEAAISKPSDLVFLVVSNGSLAGANGDVFRNKADALKNIEDSIEATSMQLCRDGYTPEIIRNDDTGYVEVHAKEDHSIFLMCFVDEKQL